MSMLTVNADDHQLMSRMHRPDPKRPVELQDKRSVVLIEPEDQARWLYGTESDARSMLVAPAVDVLLAGVTVWMYSA